MSIENFEDFEIWKLARELNIHVFKLTLKKPFCDDYRLKDQIRASAGSIMDNIAEGFERNGNKEFIQFLYIAKGSCGETRSQILRAYDIQYIEEEKMQELHTLAADLGNKIGGFINYLKKSEYKGPKYH